MGDSEFSNINFKFNLASSDRDDATKVVSSPPTNVSSTKSPSIPPLPKTSTGLSNNNFPDFVSLAKTTVSGSQGKKPLPIPNIELQQSRVSALHSMPEHSLFVPDQPLSAAADPEMIVVSRAAPSEVAQEHSYSNKNWASLAIFSLITMSLVIGGVLFQDSILDFMFPTPQLLPALPAKSPKAPLIAAVASTPKTQVASTPKTQVASTLKKVTHMTAAKPAVAASPITHAVEEHIGIKETGLEDKAVTRPVIKLYADLQNLAPSTKELGRIWNAAEENNWRTGLKSKYPWQRYKTVMEVRTGRYTQSSVILWDALDDSKLWVRMQALLGLAEFGQNPSLNHLQKALGDANKGLLTRFFMRFELKSTPQDHFILRLAMPLVDPETRLEILKTLAQHPSQANRVFVLAAAQDPDLKTKHFAQKAVATWSPEQLQAVQKDMLKQPTKAPKAEPISSDKSIPASKINEDIEDLDDDPEL